MKPFARRFRSIRSGDRRGGTAAACGRFIAVLLCMGWARSEGRVSWASPPNGDCASCHSCPSPTPDQPCLRRCTRPTAPRSGKSVPDVVLLKELEDRFLPVPFDHKGHADMAQMAGGCTKCHHYTPEGQEHPACKSCHSVQPGAGTIEKPGLKGAYHRQCLSCHREWSGDTRCDACHRSKTRVGERTTSDGTPSVDDIVGRMHPPIPEPVEEIYTTRTGPDDATTKVLFRHKRHIEGYGLRCAECHHEDNCSRCHGERRTHEQQTRTFDQHHKPCIECHREDSCDRCHYAPDASPPPPFDHARTGWTLSRYHREASCRACHATTPFEKRDTSCTACHSNWKAGQFNHAVTGQSLDETHAGLDCEACHANRRFDAPPVCADCHEPSEGITFPERRPGAHRSPP